MSNWDISFRSQQLAKQQEMGYAGIEADANARSAGMLAKGGQHIGGMIQQGRQFAAAQAMQDAHFQQQQQAQAQQFLTQVEMEKQDAASRLALRQAQMQESQLKIAAMQQLDQLGMSQEGYRSAKLQNDAAALALDEQRRKLKSESEDKHTEFMRKLVTSSSPIDLAIMGYQFDPQSPHGYSPVPAEKRDEVIGRAMNAKRRSAGGAHAEPSVQLQRVQRSLEDLQDADDGSPDVRQAIEALKARRNSLAQQVGGVTPNQGGEQKQQQGQQGAKLSIKDDDLKYVNQVEDVLGNLGLDFNFPSRKVSNEVVKHLDEIHQVAVEAAKQQPGRPIPTREDALRDFLAGLKNKGSRRHELYMAAIRQWGAQ